MDQVKEVREIGQNKRLGGAVHYVMNRGERRT